jgi:D-alanyl-D-alanine carboxypeptidase
MRALLTALLLLGGPAAPNPKPSLDAALTSGLAKTGAPGAEAAVYRCGRLVWSGAAGVVDLKSRRPVTRKTLFVLASTTKTYTATMIMRLVQRGRLTLGMKLSRFYPRMPNARRITIRMLLTHTSGLPDYLYEPAFIRGAKDPAHVWSRQVLLAGVHGSEFRPGTHFQYSNTNFLTLGGILVKAGRTRVENAFQTGIAKPLGLPTTTFTYSKDRAGLYAHPYEGRDLFVPGVGIPSDYRGEVWTDGGISTTAEELARFGDGLFGARLVGPKTLRTMTTVDRFGSGLGLFAGPFDGHSWLGHSGSYGGFESDLWYDRKRGVTIAVTVNQDDSSEPIWNAVTRAYDREAAATSCAASGS